MTSDMENTSQARRARRLSPARIELFLGRGDVRKIAFPAVHGEIVETEYSPGDCRYFSFGAGQHMIHDLTNIGDTDLIFTTVELKGSANPPLALK